MSAKPLNDAVQYAHNRRPVSSACLLIWVSRAVDDLYMARVGVISDEFWAVVEPLLPANGGRRGRPWNAHRDVVEAICWRYRTGSPWRDLPLELGRWQTVWARHFRWSTDNYKLRNAVERGYARLKQWRGIATRYDKHALTFLGGVHLTASVLHLR